jgi:SAM-dependent methyltransferase
MSSLTLHREKPKPATCRHLGAEIGIAHCQICRGRVREKVFECAVYGICTVGTKLGTTACCWDHCSAHESIPLTSNYEIIPGVPDPLPEVPVSGNHKQWASMPKVKARHRAAIESLLALDFGIPLQASGDGIVICGGGIYWPMSALAIQMIRDVCDLPIYFYHRGKNEPINAKDVQDLPDITITDLTQVGKYRILGGWEAKAAALLHCPFARVLYLDADAYPTTDPADFINLADEIHPLVCWDDMPGRDNDVKFAEFGIAPAQLYPSIQGGILAIDRVHFWRELCITHWLNQHSDYSYHYAYGDQDQWRITLAATNTPYLSLGRAPWIAPAFVTKHKGASFAHRCQGKVWAKGDDQRTSHIPGDTRYFGHLDRFITGGGDAPEVFSRVYELGLWGHGKDSGGGSTPGEAAPYLDLVNALIQIGHWQRVADLGCGDGYITVRLKAAGIIGVDCHTHHLDRLDEEYPDLAWMFVDLNAGRGYLPKADAALVKDVLHHWPNDLVKDWLEWARVCGKWKYLLLTNDFPNAIPNRDCPLGGYRPLTLEILQALGITGLRCMARYLHKEVLLLECR